MAAVRPVGQLMDQNVLVGGLFAAVGVGDLLIAQVMGSRLANPARLALQLGGVGLIVFGSLLAFGIVRLF
jgi:hypothetical protein